MRLDIELKPCPCCGEYLGFAFNEHEDNYFGIYAGTDSSEGQCVRCYTCGLRMVKKYSEEWPTDKAFKAIQKKSMGEALEEIRRRTLEEAVKAWNLRSKI